MKKLLIGGITIAVLVTGFVVATEAKKPKKEVVGLPELVVNPSVIYADKDNQVLMMLAAGKRLRKPQIQYRDSAGQWQDLGKLNDKGKDGDIAKGDKTYSLQTTIAQNDATTYRATARKGLRTLLVSPETKLAVRKGDWIVGYEIGDTGVTLDYPISLTPVLSSTGSRSFGFALEDSEQNAMLIFSEPAVNQNSTLADYAAKPISELTVKNLGGAQCFGDYAYLCIKDGLVYQIENGYGMYSDTGTGGTTVPEEVFEQVIQSLRFP